MQAIAQTIEDFRAARLLATARLSKLRIVPSSTALYNPPRIEVDPDGFSERLVDTLYWAGSNAPHFASLPPASAEAKLTLLTADVSHQAF